MFIFTLLKMIPFYGYKRYKYFTMNDKLFNILKSFIYELNIIHARNMGRNLRDKIIVKLKYKNYIKIYYENTKK